MTIPAGHVAEYDRKLKFSAGKSKRTKRVGRRSALPVWVSPTRGAFGLSIRIGDTVYDAFAKVCLGYPKRYYRDEATKPR